MENNVAPFTICNWRIEILILGICLSSVNFSRGESTLFPDPSSLESGDLVWPKRPDSIVLYGMPKEVLGEEPEREWETSKEKYLLKIENGNRTPEEEYRFNTLRSMTYMTFRHLYFGGGNENGPVNFGSGLPYTGHVGIIWRSDNVPYVIEALFDTGVRKVSYAEWCEWPTPVFRSIWS